ncbi:ARM repeat superfamily protein [Abeliophyllum distichum]|uniref:ARM repeat superfamily protein n=1 Tax=Abeliophyllum distichum TaxID=126358 RepID=A0ABD1PS02_9LAMI
MVLLNWLFQDEILFQDIVENYAGIISRKDDHYIALGWCILGRSLIEYKNTVNNIATDGITKKYNAMLKIFCSPVTNLLSIICCGSNLQEGYELPSRLSVAAADFILSLTVALTRKGCGFFRYQAKIISSDLQLGAEKAGLCMLEDWRTVFKWLLETKKHYDCFQNEADLEMVKTGALLVSSCWKHYGMLLHLEDNKIASQYKELLDQYLSGIQFYADNHAEEPSSNKDGGVDIIKFFLNCLSLLLGRLDDKKFGTAMTDFGSQLSQVLISQLSCADEEVIDGAICIFKAVIFRTNHSLSESNLDDTRQMDAILSSLLHLLDERDVAAKAVVNLVAEYCSKCSDSWCLQEVLKRIDSENVAQRRNAVDVVSDLIHISSGSVNVLSQEMWQDIANHLLGCLRDEDCALQNQASNLIPMIDPALVLPALVGLCYSAHEKVQLSASSTLIALLINHRQKPEVVCLLLDCLSNLCLNPDLAVSSAGNEEGSKVDADRLLKLLPEWAKTVEDWDVMVGPLIDKMISEPSNAVIVRFLSYISECLAEASNLVFQRLILYTRGEKVVDESFSKWQGKTDASNDFVKWEHSLFSHLCPLLIIRLLPLRVFDDLSSPLVYGEHKRKCVVHEKGYFSFEGTECVVELLINRALSKSEFEDVRKLAAELCGRIHPDVLIPIMSSQLEYAAQAKDVVMIKGCLFSVCTSLMVRGINVYKHPDLFRIRRTIQNILSWSSVDGDEIAKAQHGCIDCLALMLCTELQAPKSLRVSNLEDTFHVGNGNDCVDDAAVQGAGKIPFARKILPRVIHSARVMMEPETRVACIQILFSVVYHLKSLVSPYSSDLLTVALKSLREGSHEEKMAGAKLLASLMASDEEIVGSISGGLYEAKSLLRSLSLSDPSIDVRQICQQLLACLTSN